MKKKNNKKSTTVVAVAPPTPPTNRRLTQIERLAQLGNDYGNMLNQNTAKGLYAEFGTMTLQELQAKLKSPSLTAIERSVIIHIAKINATSKDGLDAVKYFHDRVFGKVETKLSHTGADGGPIRIEKDISIEIEQTIANMTDEEMAALEETLENLDKLVGKMDDAKKP